MKKTDFIRKFNLSRTGMTLLFADGTQHAERALYVDPEGNHFVFYKNDMYAARAYYTGGGYAEGWLTSAFGWYN